MTEKKRLKRGHQGAASGKGLGKGDGAVWVDGQPFTGTGDSVVDEVRRVGLQVSDGGLQRADDGSAASAYPRPKLGGSVVGVVPHGGHCLHNASGDDFAGLALVAVDQIHGGSYVVSSVVDGDQGCWHRNQW